MRSEIDDIFFGSFRDVPTSEPCNAYAEIIVEGIDDCSSVTDIRYQLDLFNDGDIDVFNGSTDASGEYPIGIHKITWFAEDGCGNSTSREQFIEVLDCQKTESEMLQ